MLNYAVVPGRCGGRFGLSAQFVYEGGPVGDRANVSYSIARTIDPRCSATYTACEDIALYRVTWVPMGTPPPPPPPPPPAPPLPPKPVQKRCDTAAPVKGLCFTGVDLPESFQMIDGSDALACRDACCVLEVCESWVMTITTSPCLGARFLASFFFPFLQNAYLISS